MQQLVGSESVRLDEIEFATSGAIDAAELADFYERQGHSITRDRAKLERMAENTFCFVTARRNGSLVGLARGVTDGVSGRLIECKLDPALQGPGCVTRKDGRIEHDSAGIASEMARRVIDALKKGGIERIDVTAYGTEVDFCEELGFRRVPGVSAMELVIDLSE